MVALEDIPLLWRAQSMAPHRGQCVPTGYALLDRALGGGWPSPSLIELLCDEYGGGELRLLLGLLAVERADRRVVLWLSPPFELHAIALAQYGSSPGDHWICSVSQPQDLQWAMTQALRSGACRLVIAWAPRLKPAALRSLKLATQAGHTIGVLFRPRRAARTASPATVRLELKPRGMTLDVTVLKMQGRPPGVVHLTPSEADARFEKTR